MKKGQRTRREIVNRALALAGDVGLENVTLGALASDLELSKSGLFAHFKSKEALQLSVLAEAVERFTSDVVLPARSAPRGEPRVVALFERFLAWIRGAAAAAGASDRAPTGDTSGSSDRAGASASSRRASANRCIFMALSQEYDDRPGEIRDAIVSSQHDWRAVIAHSARLAVDEGHFRADLDVEQFAFELVGIAMAFQQTANLLADERAESRARAAFDALLARSRRARR